MRKTLIALAAIAVLVVGGAVAASAQTDDADTQDSATVERETFLERVLESLVGDDTLSQQQADAVLAAVDSAKAEIRAEREAGRDAWRVAWEDEILTTEELEGLPFGERFLADDSRFAEALEDGEITRDEFRELHAESHQRHRRAHRFFGALGGDA